MADLIGDWEALLGEQECAMCPHRVLCHEVDYDGPRLLVMCHHCVCCYSPTPADMDHRWVTDISEADNVWRVDFDPALADFWADMRSQGIHVGVGDPPGCPVCDEPWPCERERSRDFTPV